MKRLMTIIEAHGRRYMYLLENHRCDSDLTVNEAKEILHRIQNVVDLVPLAIEQASQRILHDRRVENDKKILSLYEHVTNILIRGKSGAAVEFCNGLYLDESEDGLITDWQFFQKQPPADSSLVPESIQRLQDNYGKISSFTGERGFESQTNVQQLEEKGIYNGLCPKSVSSLEKRLCESLFVRLQKRRAGTEAKISILKKQVSGNNSQK